ncbi:MAG: shikimate dehydrogenase [Planctomycetales bacterium]|nr:shikimate dehydrogenase [Planctomycetales bacterium]
MICVCIGRGRHKHMMAEHAHLVEQGAKLVELRLDYIAGEVNLKRLIKDRPGPVIISCRRQADGGKWVGKETERQMLLRSAIADGVDYVDLEDDIAGSIPRFGKTKRIVSMHDFNSTPDDLEEIHARMAALDADIVKIATMANNPHDNVRMLNLMAKSDVPTVGMCMGEMGMPTRILASRFGAPFTYATFHHERALAPGQLSYKQMTEIYNYENINKETTVFGVVADPIGHSASPVVHNAAFQERKINAVYVPFRVPRQHLEKFLAEAESLGIEGLSVTIPHKEAVLHVCRNIAPAVKGIGAANTILFDKGGPSAFNTDCDAAMESLAEAMRISNGESFAGKTALLLGAGGVVKALAYGLRERGATVFVAARNSEKAKPLTALGCKIIDWDARYTINCDVLINGTPIGMHPNVNETPYEKHRLRPAMIVFDTVYNPEQTLLIKEARQKHCKTVTGVDMFIRQAALQFMMYTGQEAPTKLMYEVLKRFLGPIK